MEETISYGIPTWKYKGKWVLYFAAYESHMSIHAASMEMIESIKDELGNFTLNPGTIKSAGTVQFTEDNPVPEALIRLIVSSRVATIDK